MSSPEKEKSNKGKKSAADAVVKYMGMASQMAITVLIFVLIGQKIDSHLENTTPYATLIAVILGTVAALYLSLKDLIKR